VRFGDFEFDPRTGQLRRGDTLIKLQQQPAKILALLVSRPGEVVTRQELAREVWGSETFVDFEQGLNFAIRQIRAALGDDAEGARFLQTLPKRGYRFITLEDALSDPAYSLPDSYVGEEGTSWLDHWAITRGQPPQNAPTFPQAMQERAKALPRSAPLQ